MYNDKYVYLHKCPVTKAILYVGKGSRGRAWVFSGGRRQAAYGVRDRKHYLYLRKLVLKGYLPCDWVKIISRNMTDKAAYKLEKKLILKYKPLFNKDGGWQVSLTLRQVRKAQKLRAGGMYYLAISKKLGCSAMVVWRLLNGKSKVYNNMLGKANNVNV